MTRRYVDPGAPGSWIVVPKWDRFQHYGDRRMVWIKTYTDLLSDDAYLSLNFVQRGVLHGIWLAYAASHRQLRGDTAALTRQLGERVVRATLVSLSDAGFIRFVASKPLAQSRAEEKRTAKGRTVVRPPARARARAKGLPDDLKHEVDKLMPALNDVDAGSRKVIEREASGLPLAAVAKVRESAELNGPVGVGYVVNALRSERAGE